MKISMARMIANLAARGRGLGNRFAWWSRWFPPATTVDADRFRAPTSPTPITGGNSRGHGLPARLWSRRRSRPLWLRCLISGAGS